MVQRKQFRNFKKREPSLPIEQKIERFILRNSKNGFFTKVSTIPHKFEISESKTWDIVGELLTEGTLESTHDKISGEMKLCETGKTYAIMDLEIKRKKENSKVKKKRRTIETDEKKSKDSKNETM